MSAKDAFRLAFGILLKEHGFAGGVAVVLDLRALEFTTFCSGEPKEIYVGMEELRGRISDKISSGEFDPSEATLNGQWQQ